MTFIGLRHRYDKMRGMKRILLSVLASVVIFTTVGGGAVGAISEELAGAVSMNCVSIVGQLKNVRYYDRKAREYLGNRYEKLIGEYVTNLNVRLVRNNMTNMELQELQIELVAAHSGFKSEYAKYATELDALIGMDCVNKPGEFYASLENVRVRRAGVREWVEKVNVGLAEFRGVVIGMRGNYE